MATNYSRRNSSSLRANRHCPREREINILLLGPTGVGKSTFINAFANYITYDTLEEAVNNDMQVVIPTAFSHTEHETFDERLIVIGREDEHEKFSIEGQSATQQCRSFLFPIGNRNLRFIDTPGIGDTRGIEQDEKNFQEILNFISQYEHLNAIFIMLKPGEHRLNILFRFSVNELLRHLHIEAAANLNFVFTSARATFFTPGPSKQLIEGLLNKHRIEQNVIIPFSRENSFLFDNEAFRYLALCKNGIHINVEETQSYSKSWDHSVKEYARLMKSINACSLHAVSNTVSLNEAEQLIRKFPRPMAETAKLIEENIQLAQDHKRKVLTNPRGLSEGIPQNDAQIVYLKHPRTVCVGDRCCRVVDINGEKKLEYLSICHDECYLNGVKQETLYDQKLQDCTAMEPNEGFCLVCDCHWLQHKHITYEYKTNRTNVKSVTTRSKRTMTMDDIDKRISDLRKEERKIQNVYKKLVRFLHVNALLSTNDDYIDYLEYFIREERMKQGAGAENTQMIDNLQKIKDDYRKEMDLFKRTAEEQKNTANTSEVIKPEDIFDLVNELYELPITGEQIRHQVEGIKIGQERNGFRREIYVDLPAKAATSKVMRQLQEIVSDDQQKI
ncbi:hypothetical protein I4U23_019711 [Adineta vaga]|nr:hypothetical protein I4U23_019711 [Adineta vaga]